MFQHESNHPLNGGEAPGRPPETALMIRRCTNCAKFLAPLTVGCSFCQSFDLEWVPSLGLGTIVSWKVVHLPPSGQRHGKSMPSTVAIVELDDGPWVYSTIEGDVPRSSQPVRVKFEARPRSDRFPVFAIWPADLPDSQASARSESGNPTSVRSKQESHDHQTYDASWIRSALRQCDLLDSSEAVDTDARSLIRFAIRQAPFGGASASELLMAFGVTRMRFVTMLHEALSSKRTDTQSVRRLKRHLLDSLMRAWRANPYAPSTSYRVG